ncbi:MAG: glutamate mutase L [Herpetosiphonaceae bacterium]|nr:glutamate mutase L [Herpetosiphonaceae bacterium]
MSAAANLPEEYRALLVAEIGSAITRVSLIDEVDETYRLLARSETWSTLYAPVTDALVGIIRAVAAIAETTGRELVRDNRLLIPMDHAGNGVAALVVTTSAGGAMPVLVMGLAADGHLQSAQHAARASYTRLLQPFTVSETTTATGDWLNRRLLSMAQSHPEAIMLAVGRDETKGTALQRLIDIVRLIERQQPAPSPIIFAGDAETDAKVKTALDSAIPLTAVDSLRPTPEHARIEPARALLRKIYTEHHLQDVPWSGGLAQLRVTSISSAAEDQGLMIRFLGERYKRNILALDMGASTATAQLMSAGHYSEAIMGSCGTQRGAIDVLQMAGAESIMRWLPWETDAESLENRLLNRRLASPHAPADLDDLLLDHALLRAGLQVAYQALRSERPEAPIDLIIAGGAVARAPRPGLAALTLLDALQLDGSRMTLALDLYLDSLSLLPASGALARVDAEAAACLAEQDALNSGPLATVIVPHGTLTGQVAEVELTPVGGPTLRAVVAAGTLVRLPLPRGQYGTLSIQPSPQVAIGANPPGAEVVTREAAIAGSALGVIIDARPRGSVPPAEFGERQRELLTHLRALDALPPNSSYVAPEAAGAPTAPTATMPTTVPAKPTSAPQDVDLLPTGDNALAALRQDLVSTTEPKRGLFRNKQ